MEKTTLPEIAKPIYQKNKIDWITAVSIGIGLREIKEFSQWFIGDLAHKVKTEYGEKSIPQFAREIGLSPGTIYEYKRVAELIPKDKRLLFLSFRHHQMVARLNNAPKWLEKAHDNEWTTRQLYRAIKNTSIKNDPHRHEWQNLFYRRCKICTKQERVVEK